MTSIKGHNSVKNLQKITVNNINLDIVKINVYTKALMYVIITHKYEKDPIKNNREKVATPFFKLKHYLLPWKPVVGSGRNSNSSKLLCMSPLPASMKRIR